MTTSDTQIQKVNTVPGINRNTTDYDAEGQYVDGDHIRFRYKRPEKIGGWTKDTPDHFIGVPRDMLTWVDLDEEKYIGVGTNEKLELYNGGQIIDITPIDSSASASNVFSVASGSSFITVSVNGHNRNAGDWVLFETTASVAGINLLDEYQIVSAGTNYFIVQASTSATTSVSAVGGPAVFQFLLDSGEADNTFAAGWGAGTWGTPGVSVGTSLSAGWGRPRGGSGVGIELRQWSLDNWGEDLLANPRGGKIYTWVADDGTDTRARVISSAAPSVVNFMLVAQPARHVVAFGTHNVSGLFDPLLVRWSDSENYGVWNAAVTNQAGSFRLESGSFIITALKTRREIVVFTDEALHSMRRIGGDFVFSFDNLGKIPGIVSQHAAVDVNGVVIWMAPTGFYLYDGVAQTLPCSLQEYIFSPNTPGSLNFDQKEKVHAGINTEFDEVWWFYPAGGEIENSRYVVFNYLDKVWYDGSIERTTWNDIDIFDRPYATDADGYLYAHEVGKDDDGSNLRAFLRTADFDIGDGQNLVFIDRIIPDGFFEKTTNITMTTKKYPNSIETQEKGPYAVTSATQKISMRARGRQAAIEYSTSVQGSDFRLGITRISIKPDGER